MVIWAGLLFAVVLRSRDFRDSLRQLIRVAGSPPIVLAVAGLALMTCGLVLLASLLGVWDSRLWKEAGLWFFGVGLGLVVNSSDLVERPQFARRTAGKLLRFTVVLEFIVNLAVLPLPLELVLVPILTFFVLMSAVAEATPETGVVKGCADAMLSVAGFGLLLYVAVRVATDWSDFANERTLETFLLPSAMTIGVLPYIYALGLVGHYQKAFIALDRFEADSRGRLRRRMALLTSIGLRGAEIAAFSPTAARDVAEADSWGGARTAVRQFRRGRWEEREFARRLEERLQRYAGVEGTDDQGRQLDRREFEATKEALWLIHSAMEGWYANDARYTDEFLEVGLLEPYPGLPPEHGIVAHVSPDGTAWWTWRRTVTGWCLGIGAAGPPPSCVVYDAQEPPSGGPREDRAWVRDSVNWADDPAIDDVRASFNADTSDLPRPGADSDRAAEDGD